MRKISPAARWEWLFDTKSIKIIDFQKSGGSRTPLDLRLKSRTPLAGPPWIWGLQKHWSLSVYAFSPQLGGMGGNFPPISGARKMPSPHSGGNKSQAVFQENSGFWRNLKVLRLETGWKHRKTSIFRRRLRRAVEKKDLESFWVKFWKFPLRLGGNFPPIIAPKALYDQVT